MSETVLEPLDNIRAALWNERLERLEIRVGRTSDLLEAIERSGTTLVSDPKATASTLWGIPVVESHLIANGFAALYRDGKFSAFYDLRPRPTGGQE